MAEVLCPQCHRLNPEEAETCQYCSASLKRAADNPSALGNAVFNADSDAEVNPEIELPDWLRSWGEENEDDNERPAKAIDPLPAREGFDLHREPEEQENQPASTPDQEPDWLTRIRERNRQDQEQEPEALGELPDWLAREDSPGSLPEDSGSSDEWLQNLRTDDGTDQPATAGGLESQPVESEELPDWLKEVSTSQSMESQPGEGEKSPEPAAQPDWFSDLPESEPVSQPENPVRPFNNTESLNNEQETGPVAQGMAEEDQPVQPKGLPDWMANLQSEENPPAAPTTSAPALIYSDESKGQESFEQVQPFSAEELPDWLARMSSPEESLVEEGTDAQSKKEGDDEITLAPADLPSWVQAMRPIESATPEAPTPPESDEKVEKAGPLAGLRGILPTAEPLGPEVRKPSAYSVNLLVSEKQRINAALFETILSAERQPQTPPRARPFSSQQILRTVIAIVLVLAAFLPIWQNSQQMNLPGYLPPEAAALQAAINGLSPDSTVLVAVDFEAAFSGEVEAVSSSVVSHLMSKSANLILISTNPVGQVLGGQLLNQAQQSQPAYNLNEKTLNLGYLAGGASGLFNFALQPQTAAPLTVEQAWAWNTPLLQNVHALSGFAGVIVVTDNADTARTWVEQVQPLLGTTPLFMVTSAQAGTLIRPYYDAGQVQGFIYGLAGGASYEQALQVDGASTTYWDAYQVGILVAVVLIAIGGLIAVGNTVFARRKIREEE